MAKNKANLHFVTLRQLLPLIITIPFLLHINPWWRTFSGLIDQPDLYATTVFSIAGLFFLVETKFAMNAAGRTNFAGILVLVLAIGMLLVAALVATDVYNFEDGRINTIISILLVLAVLMYVVQAEKVILHRKALELRLHI